MFEPGQTLAGRLGRYEIAGVHAAGGFGVTYRARRAGDGLEVIVKVLRLDRVPGWKAIELFEREAIVLRVLDHPGIPKWVDDFSLTTPDAPSALALVQEFVPGSTLRERTRAGGLTRAQSLAWLDEILGVLEYLHERAPPVIHRDITPKNIILRPDGAAVLVDFGSVQAALRSANTAAPTSAGTFGYAAPEQFLGRATPASDLYGLAMTYLACASGLEPERMPLVGSAVDVRRVLRAEPRLVRLLESMAAPDPRRRPQDAAFVRRQLAAIRAGGATAMADREQDDLPTRPLDGEESLRTIERRLREEGFEIEPAGELGRTTVSLTAFRPAGALALSPPYAVYVVRSDELEGASAEKPVSAVALSLLARTAGDAHPNQSGLLSQVLSTAPVVLVLVLAAAGAEPLLRGRVEAGLRRRDEVLVIAALVDLITGAATIMAPPHARDDRHAEALALLERLVASAAADSDPPLFSR